VESANLVQGDILRLLGEIGLAGVGIGYYAAADRVFDTLALVRPQSELPWIGKALIHLSNERFTEARKVLEKEALARQPQNALVKSLIGHALQREGLQTAAFRVLSEVAESEEEAPGVLLAKSLLETYKTDLWR
jgi:predicted Zn-dependent protease